MSYPQPTHENCLSYELQAIQTDYANKPLDARILTRLALLGGGNERKGKCHEPSCSVSFTQESGRLAIHLAVELIPESLRWQPSKHARAPIEPAPPLVEPTETEMFVPEALPNGEVIKVLPLMVEIEPSLLVENAIA